MEYLEYPAKAIANHFLDLSEKDGGGITPLQIQKLIYIAHGWHMAFYDEPLVCDEYAEAWDYGPVFPSLYYEFKSFGASPIVGRAKVMEYIEEFDKWDSYIPVVRKNDLRARIFFNRIWETHKDLTGGQFIELTHIKDSPWYQTRLKHENIINASIENNVIKEYYDGKLKEHREKNAG